MGLPKHSDASVLEGTTLKHFDRRELTAALLGAFTSSRALSDATVVMKKMPNRGRLQDVLNGDVYPNTGKPFLFQWAHNVRIDSVKAKVPESPPIQHQPLAMPEPIVMLIGDDELECFVLTPECLQLAYSCVDTIKDLGEDNLNKHLQDLNSLKDYATFFVTMLLSRLCWNLEERMPSSRLELQMH